MSALLWLIVLAPFAGALVLALFGASMPKKLAGTIGCLWVAVSWISALILGAHYYHGSHAPVYSQSLGWIDIAWFHLHIGLRLDMLSLAWLEIVTFVGLLILLYSAQSMFEEDGYSRFFCYMNLFVGSMLTLVLADSLLLLYLGWEGVGLCSYLLIGFWYKERYNCDAARKAFIVTRVGDTALAIALFLLARQCHSLDIETIIRCSYGPGAVLIAALILGGAVGKSAQLPLQTWLPDAMAGPSPVSALIHAATMVTAGVYLIARLSNVFAQAIPVLNAVAIIGTATLIYAGVSALTQHDIKRVLAYSTISQIGYMFLALGVGAVDAAVFHFVTHAFFKALLFLSAGIVIDGQGDEHNIFKMGGLWRAMPVAFWTFLIGAASLSALPFITAGFFSKETILTAAHSSPFGSEWFLILGLVGSLLTAAYAFRVVFVAFFGEQKIEVTKRPGGLVTLSVAVLSFFAITAGYVGPKLDMTKSSEQILVAISAGLVALGIYAAYLYYTRPAWSEVVAASAVGRTLHRFFFVGWGFDWLYEHIFVIPLKAVARANKGDIVDTFFADIAHAARSCGYVLSLLQTGRVRNYAAGLVLGGIILTLLMLLR